MSKHKNPASRKAPRTGANTRSKAWRFEFDPQRPPIFTVHYPDRSTTVIDPADINERCGEYISVQLSKPWPQIDRDFGTPVTLRNPLESAFYDVLIRMSPKGHAAWKKMDYFFQMQTNYHLHSCLYLIAAIECGEILQSLAAPICNGATTASDAMALINGQRFPIRSSVVGDGWFEQRWNLLKDQIGLNTP